jgi:hypothetical protein
MKWEGNRSASIRHGESSDAALGQGRIAVEENDVGHELGVVQDYPGVVARVIQAAEHKGVRLQENEFVRDDIERPHPHVLIFRGQARRLLDFLYQPVKKTQPRRDLGLGGKTAAGKCVEAVGYMVHEGSLGRPHSVPGIFSNGNSLSNP